MIKQGIINVYKPMGMTSHDCIYVMRRLTGIKRIGHTGTLDPNATGVLPICIGSAARVTEYLDLDFKKYRCSMVLGIETDTLDIWGATLSDKREELRAILGGNDDACEDFKDKIRRGFEKQKGVILQYPPKYSAVRVAGRRLYEYARSGESVEIKPRKVYIKNIEIQEISLPELKVSFSVECSKGTYIRTICSDVGEATGFGAAMSSLEREASGVFKAENAVDLEHLRALSKETDPLRKKAAGGEITLQEQERLADIERETESYILEADYPLVNFGTVVIKTAERAEWFVNGGHIGFHEVDVIKEPRYKTETFPLEIREEYRGAYNIYAPGNGGAPDGHEAGMQNPTTDALEGNCNKGAFLGVAFFNKKYKKLVADKVFARR